MFEMKVDSPYPLEFAHSTDAGADIRANERVIIPVKGRRLVSTGVYLEMPERYGDTRWNAEIRPRSGLAHNYGVTVLNAPGTIDQSYRGEVKVNLINLGESPFEVNPGDKIAQLVFGVVAHVNFIEVDKIDTDTERGASGHGSTGMQ